MFEMKQRSSRDDAHRTSGQFFDSVLNSAMAIRREKLRQFQKYGATEHYCTHKTDFSWVDQTKEQTEDCKGADVFKAG